MTYPKTTLPIRWGGIGLILAAVTWISLLLYGAHALRNSDMTTYNVAVGSWALNTLERVPQGGGRFSLTISFGPGLLWLFLILAAVGVCIGIFLAKQEQHITKHNQDNQ